MIAPGIAHCDYPKELGAYPRGELGRTLVQRRFGDILAAGPWLWPTSIHPAFESFALLHDDAPPQPVPGAVLLSSVEHSAEGGRRAALWLLSPTAPRGPAPRCVAFNADAHHTWRVAQQAADRAIPALWRALQPNLVRWPQPERALLLNQLTWLPTRTFGTPDHGLTGDALGAAFALAITSHLLDVPIPGDVVIIAQLDASGRLHPVDHLDARIAALLQLTPGVRRLVVALHQQDAASLVAHFSAQLPPSDLALRAKPLQVLSFDHLADVVDMLWDDTIHQRLVALQSRTQLRRHLVDDLFDLLFHERAHITHWGPLARFASVVLEHRAVPLSPDQTARLVYLQDIASRHQSIREPMPLPGTWLQHVTQPQRLQWITFVLQYAADAGHDDWPALEAFATQHLTRGPDAFPGHLHLLTAWARVRLLTASPEEALEDLLEVARGWRSRRALFNLAEVLTQIFPLAAALLRKDAFEEAEQLRKHATQWHLTPWSLDLQRRLDLRHAQGHLLFGVTQHAAPILDALAHDPDIPTTLRAIAWRWLAWTPLATSSSALEALDALTHATPRVLNQDVVLLERCRFLIRLDDALNHNDTETLRALIEHQTRWEPHPTTLLLRQVLSEDLLDYGRFLQRFFPL